MSVVESLALTDWQLFKLSQSKQSSDKEKGDRFELLVQRYLQNDPTYKSRLKHVWLLREVPLSIKTHLNLPDTDQGIDLIAQTYDDEYWAVQCKYREDETHSLNFREVSTFTALSFGICKNIAFGLICSTGERYSNIFKQQDKVGFITSETWRALDPFYFEDQPSKTISKALKPYPHQIKAIRAAEKHFINNAHSRGKLVMPCGTGKSLAAFWIGETLNASTILVAVPSLSLLRQTIKVWMKQLVAKNRVGKFEWLCVCSDATVKDMDDDELKILSRDMGIPCVTDEAAIYQWLSKSSPRPLRIVFTTYQSGKPLAAASRKANVSFDLGVFDEAHKTTGRAESFFSWLLYEKNIQIAKRLFMTATERYYRGRSNEVVSMEDESLYGGTVLDMSFREAQEEEPPIICDYRILTLYITRDEIKEMVRKNAFVHPSTGNWNDDVGANMLAALVALRKAMRDFPIRHAVSYHSSISKAKTFQENADIFTESFPEFGELKTYHVKGSDPASYRDRVLTEFGSSKKGLITNARCLVEGIDLPEIDCIVFADPRKSIIDIVQALGRALRPAPNKDFAYIVIPVIVDSNLGFEEMLSSSSFADLFAILRALASNDERVIDYFRAAGETTNERGSVIRDITDAVRLSKVIDVQEFIGAVELYCWDNLRKLSYKSFARSRSYVRKLKLASELEWRYYCEGKLMTSEPKPKDIPDNPDEIYSEYWAGWNNWLGSKPTQRFSRFFNFEAAKAHAQTLGLYSESEWNAYILTDSKPMHVPAHPDKVYVEWEGWDDWLHTKGFFTYEAAQGFVRKLGLKDHSEWNKYCAGLLPELRPKPKEIPNRPQALYRNQWIDWKAWLGLYLPFEQARAYARSMGFWSEGRWKDYANNRLGKQFKFPDNVPSNPELVYKSQWVSWQDWLRGSAYLPFAEARRYVHKLNLRSKTEWDKFITGKSRHGTPPIFIPQKPITIYQDSWVDWNDWIGWDDLKIGYMNFEKARRFVKKLGLKSIGDWAKYCKGAYAGTLPRKPTSIPIHPKFVYWKEWRGFQHWLGNDEEGHIETSKSKDLIPFNIARGFVRGLDLHSYGEWKKYIKGDFPDKKALPDGIPSEPERWYEDEWHGWADWLGIPRPPDG